MKQPVTGRTFSSGYSYFNTSKVDILIIKAALKTKEASTN